VLLQALGWFWWLPKGPVQPKAAMAAVKPTWKPTQLATSLDEKRGFYIALD
jgi:hypothetical protein